MRKTALILLASLALAGPAFAGSVTYELSTPGVV